MKTKSPGLIKSKRSAACKILSMILLFLLELTGQVYAQDANAGINEATSQVKSYFSTGTSLMYAIGAISGLVGAVKV